MEFGIALATAANSWVLVQRAEELGFSHAWFYDTQLLSADCFVAMGATAVKTKRIRLGTGVLIPSNRIAPVSANALATLNRLAPGRIDFGVGTGFTGRRTMGLGAIKLKHLEEYIRVVRGLLNEEVVETELEGQTRKVQFLNPDLKLINTESPIPLHISAFGPKSRSLTAKLGAGWLNFLGDVSSGIRAIEAMRQSWRSQGRDTQDLLANGFVLGCILEPDEPCNSSRALAQAGPRAAVALHRAADEAIAGLSSSGHIPESIRGVIDNYVKLSENFQPEDAKYLMNHRGHLMFVREQERPFITEELIRKTTFTGTAKDIEARIGELRDAGYTQFTIQIVPGQEEAIEDWALIKKNFA